MLPAVFIIFDWRKFEVTSITSNSFSASVVANVGEDRMAKLISDNAVFIDFPVKFYIGSTLTDEP